VITERPEFWNALIGIVERSILELLNVTVKDVPAFDNTLSPRVNAPDDEMSTLFKTEHP